MHVIILAAGRSRRFCSEKSKVLHHLGGQPVLAYALANASALNPGRITLVASPQLTQEKDLKVLLQTFPKVTVVQQNQPKGTADAVSLALENQPLSGTDLHSTLVLFGDSPLMPTDTLQTLMAQALEKKPDVWNVAMRPLCPSGYGRCVTEKDRILKIIEEKEASEDQKKITLCNGGVFWFSARAKPLLKKLVPHQGETYLPHLVEKAAQSGLTCHFLETDPDNVLGVNTRAELAAAEALLQKRWRQKFLNAGVTLKDPASTFFSFDTRIDPDCTIAPHVTFGPGVQLASRVHVKAFCVLRGVQAACDVTIGPFAHVHDQVHLAGPKTTVGNFVEITRSTLHTDVKVKHLTYLGDADIASDVNIGAGTITCNFDGTRKHATVMKQGAFVGSNTALVAPLTVGAHAVIGAGSTITQNVPDKSLVVARADRRTVQNWRPNRRRPTASSDASSAASSAAKNKAS